MWGPSGCGPWGWAHTPGNKSPKRASVQERGIPLFRTLNIKSSLASRCEGQSGTFPQSPDLTGHVSIAQSLPPAICRERTWRVLNCSFSQTVQMACPYYLAFSLLLSCQLITRLLQWYHWFPGPIPVPESWTCYVRICISTVIPEYSDANYSLRTSDSKVT